MSEELRMRNVGVAVLLLLLGACGFEPLYVQRKSSGLWYFEGTFDTSISSQMAQIKIDPIANRFGQQLRNSLLDLITPQGAPKNPKYHLSVSLRSRNVVQQAMRDDITATSERVSYVVDYSLWQNNEECLKGDSVAYVSYDIMANPYSTTMAQKKTEADAAKIIANDIALRLGAYFHSQMKEKGPNHAF